MVGIKAPHVSASRHGFVFNLPSVSDAANALYRFATPEMHVWRSVNHTLERAFFTEGGRESFRKGLESGKSGIEGASKSVGVAAEVASQAHKYGKALTGSIIYGEQIKQMAQDIMRLKADYRTAEIAAAAGHKAAASMQAFLHAPLREAEAALQRETTVLFDFYRLAEHSGAGITGRVAKLALAGEKMLGKSSLGRQIIKTNRIMKSPQLEHSLLAAGTVIEAWKGWDSTKGVSQSGRATAAAVWGAVTYGFDRSMGELGIIDLGVKHIGKAIGNAAGVEPKVAEETLESMSFSKWKEGTANTYFQIGRAVLHWDASPLSDLHRANMKGENGRILQGYAMIGETISHSAVADQLMDGAISLSSTVSKGYTRSLQWWRSAGFASGPAHTGLP